MPRQLVFGIGFFSVTALAVDTGEDSAYWAEEMGQLDRWLVSDRPRWKELAALRWRATRDVSDTMSLPRFYRFLS